MIDPITQLILEQEEEKLKVEALDHILEGYDLKCQACGRVIKIIKDGQGPLSCCNQRMFVMGSNPEDPAEDIEEVRKTLKGIKVDPDFMVALSDVNFSPYDQSDAQKRAEAKRKKKVSEAGFETKPKGWTDSSVKKYGKSLVKGGGTKEGFFDKCVKKMKDKMDNPEGFCASVKDESHDSTYWRGKDKSPQEVGKDVKKHKNV
jgi:desulfoferrodoxin-like iron-binding protein